MPRHYQNAVVLSDGRKVGYGLFRRGETWYVRFVDGTGARVKKSLGELPDKPPRPKGRWWLRQTVQYLRERQLKMVAEDVIRFTFSIKQRILAIQDEDARRELTGKLRVAKTPSALALIESELKIHERLEQPVILD
jgi:hypothetical protein